MFKKGAFLQGIQPDGDTKQSSHSEKDYKLKKNLFKKNPLWLPFKYGALKSEHVN